MTESTPEPALSEEKSASRQTASRARTFWIWVWVLLALGIFGYATSIVAPVLYSALLKGERAAERVSGAETRLTKLEDGIGAIRMEQAGLLDAVMDLDALSVDLESRIATISRSIEGLKAEVGRANAGDMERRILALEQRPADGAVASGLTGEFRDLARRVAELEQAFVLLRDASTVHSRIGQNSDTAQKRIATLERSVAELDAAGMGARGALIIASAQLQARLATAKSFSHELEAVWAVATVEGIVDSTLATTLSELRPLSAGVPTVAELVQAFQALAGNLVAAEVAGSTGEDAVWVAELWNRVRGVVKVRRTGDVDGDDAEARVARAEVRLQEGNLTAAVEEIAGLNSVASELAVPWLAQARNRITVDAAADRIGVRAIVAITAVSAPAP